MTQSEEGDEAAVGQPEQGDAAHLSAEDLQDAGAGQEPELTMNLPPEDEPATDAAAVAQAEQENAPDLGAADLQDAGVDTSEAADQELVDATKCAYCGQPFSSDDPAVMKDGRLVHRKECVKWTMPIAIAAE